MAFKTGYTRDLDGARYSKYPDIFLVVMPIALRLSFKPLTSNFVNLVLTSSVTYGITLMEIMGVAKTVSARSNRPFEIYVILLVSYCAFTYLVSFVAKAIDRKIHINL